MDQIAVAYQGQFSHIEQLIMTTNGDGEHPNLSIASTMINGWRHLVRTTIDPLTAVGFDTVPGNSMVPVAWDPFSMNAAAMYSDCMRMKAQMQWLINRQSSGQVTVMVTGNSNQLNVGDHNTISGDPAEK